MPVGGPPLPPVLPAPALAMGSFCYTPIGGFGPGPMQPVGTPCFVPTFQGPVGGRVGQ